MRPLSTVVLIASLLMPAAAMAGPEGTFHVKGVNPDDGRDYTGTVKVVRKGEMYRVVWQIGDDETVGIGLGIRVVDGQMVAGPASDKDTGIAISYTSGSTLGNATYTEFSDGTWRGIWAYKGYKNVSTEEWVPTVRQIKAKAVTVFKPKIKPATTTVADSDIQKPATEEAKAERRPVRLLSLPLPAMVGPKS